MNRLSFVENMKHFNKLLIHLQELIIIPIAVLLGSFFTLHFEVVTCTKNTVKRQDELTFMFKALVSVAIVFEARLVHDKEGRVLAC